MSQNQPVDANDQLVEGTHKLFNMIDNYIYLYHTDTLIAIPAYPEQIDDNMAANFQSATPLSRSAPIYSYSSSGPRSFNVTIALHRDLMNSINTSMSRLSTPNLEEEDYVDRMIREVQAAALPKYASEEKKVDPPLVAIRFGDDIFCKGIVDGGVTVSYSGPLIPGVSKKGSRYAVVNVAFTIKEVDPYDADSVIVAGGFRGLSTTLETRVYK